MEKTIDARGIPCPGPVIKAKEALKEIGLGSLNILVDDEIAVQNLIKLGTYSGLKSSSIKGTEKDYVVTFSLDGRETKEEIEAVCIPDSRKKGLVVVISSDQMGTGDEKLGHLLMKGFLYALTQEELLPETVLLYNGGAKLSVAGSESVEDLKSLEAQGVEILTCGTCLNYYGISEKLQAGSVTNMYEIAEKMIGAEFVIRP